MNLRAFLLSLFVATSFAFAADVTSPATPPITTRTTPPLHDGIFPPEPAAKSVMDFDGRGFIVNGQRIFLSSGSIHYARVPHELWRDRLLRLKRAGFNTVQTYAFWNYHEEKEGAFDFSGDKDMGAFLDIAKDVGLYAIVRVGPYVCAEWDSGGYPVWLRFKDGVRVREDNAPFIAEVDKWYNHVLPIVRDHQFNRGGNVILVQLENEHPLAWGTEMPNGYFRNLLETARANGIEVPCFFSGLHHGHDPAGNKPWDSVTRVSPWMSTETWPGWYDLYGELSEKDLRTYDRAFWKVIAFGGNGQNFYMIHGGSNFDHWADNENFASYDYGAPIGETGDLRQVYYRFKRAALFASSFGNILANSVNSDEQYKDFANGVRVLARTSPSGSAVFLDNNTDHAVTTTLKSGKALTVAAGEIAPILADYEISPAAHVYADARVLGMFYSVEPTLVIYGSPGESYSVHRRDPDDAFRTTQMATGKFSETTPKVQSVGPFRVLALTTEQADRTYFANGLIIVGAEYVGEVTHHGKAVNIVAERRSASSPISAVAFDEAGTMYSFSAPAGGAEMQAPALSQWSQRVVDGEAAVDFDDSKWTATETPQEMGYDGDDGAYAWYRTKIHADKDGAHYLNMPIAADWVALYLDGQRVKLPNNGLTRGSASFAIDLHAGDHTLAALTAHYGRNKLFNYLGPLKARDNKGIAGEVTLSSNPGTAATLTQWRFKALPKDPRLKLEEIAALDTTDSTWADAPIESDAFAKKPGWAWFVTELPGDNGSHHVVHFENVDDRSTIYLNGAQVGSSNQYGVPFDIVLDRAWNPAGKNRLAVLVHNTDGPGGIMAPVEIRTMPAGAPVKNWKMRGGVAMPSGTDRWSPLAPTTEPTFYRATFSLPAYPATGAHPIYRVSVGTMSRGFVWLNGHNLGRYPERLKVDGLYLPEPWLREGANELAILDEDGKSPEQVHLVIEKAASREIVELNAP